MLQYREEMQNFFGGSSEKKSPKEVMLPPQPLAEKVAADVTDQPENQQQDLKGFLIIYIVHFQSFFLLT